MPKDYAHRTQKGKRTPSQKQKQGRGFPWVSLLILIVLIALIVVGSFYARRVVKAHASIKGGAPVQQAQITKKPVQTAPVDTTPEIKFDFYKELPKIQVPVNDATNQNVPYLLQLATFTTESDAEALSDKLADKGISADIRPIIHGNQTLYRLQLGPYKNQATAQTEHDQLQAQRVPSILVQA